MEYAFHLTTTWKLAQFLLNILLGANIPPYLNHGAVAAHPQPTRHNLVEVV
jgi:hypothetical protein